MQTDGYVEANRHIFYIFHFERTKLHSVYDSENEKEKASSYGSFHFHFVRFNVPS